MADKSPKRPSTKKVGMTLKERRSAKKLKHEPLVGSAAIEAARAKSKGNGAG